MTTLRLTCITTCLLALAFAGCKTDPSGDETIDSESDGGPGETGDGQGEGDGDGDNESAFGACGDETETVLEDLAAVPAGFDSSVEQLLAGIEGEFAGTFTWGPADGGWMVAHAGTESPLTASLAHEGGEVRLIEVENEGQPPDGELGGPPCTNYLVVDMQLGFATDDGVFAESMSVPLAIPGAGSESQPFFNESLDFATLMGSLSLDDFSVDMGMITDVVLMGTVGDAGLVGELGMEVIISEGPDGLAAFGLIASYDAARQ